MEQLLQNIQCYMLHVMCSMIIAIDGRSLQDQPWTGVGNYTYNLLHTIFELDKENQYVVWYNACGKLDVPLFAEYSNVKIYRTHWPNKLLNLSMKIFNVPKLEIGTRKLGFHHDGSRASNKTYWELDIFFLPNLNFIALAPNTKLIIAAHDLSFEHFPEFFSQKSRLWHKIINPRALFARADQIIAVSEHTKNDLTETYSMPEEKITTVYPGISTPVNSELVNSLIRDQSTNQQINKLTNQPPYILYFGALEPRKNIEGIISAYELLKNPPQLIIAGCSNPYVSKLKQQIKVSKCRDKIQIIENPDEQKKKELYAGAKLFIYPSFYEGFGFPPLEAMSAGIPVIASSSASVPEICNNAALLVNPFNINEIKQGMKILLEDQTLREQYIQAGYERIKQFSWQTCAQQTLEIFKTIRH